MSAEKSAREAVARLRDRLAYAGIRVKDARVHEKMVLGVLAEAVREAKGILSVSEMAKLSGVSRDTIYKMLEERE